MKTEEIRTQLQAIEAELATLAPISDSELEAQVAAGADAAELVAQDNERAMRRRVLNIQRQGLNTKLSAAIKEEAGPTVAQHQKEREKAVQAARKALQNAHAAADALAAALGDWDQAARDAEFCGIQANNAAKEAGIPKPVEPVGIGSQEFAELDKRVYQVLRPQRVPGVQLGKQQIESGV
ncbi:MULTISPECIES: hypothetical protein [Marinobacter]|uniref:Uncharacterized protein n=1 Tax=Marinobacter nauticus TaxID=2743 RepID=A0A368VB04_MARNT|nr:MULTISPECIES: hypothetical protein [Marinobacter]ERS89468.1 hypothetical protein Q667_01675 [Marinobacter sp. C1S70]RBP77047.1 hypothetical protein DET64_101232 [Marinobacter nauticus]RCW37893.1 hypothetical protein DET51_101231 [Marinobacter nauticus]TPW23547.1 hypothetical protein FH712_10675 [Marinobacter nauticus]